MAKRKVSRKYKPKAMMEKQLQERKAPSQPVKKRNWKQFIKEMPSRITRFFKDVIRELKRVTWPTKKALVNYTIVVVVTIIIFGVILGVFDLSFIQLLDWMAKI